MVTPTQIDTVTRHYLIAALWADAPEGTNPRAPKHTEARARAICAAFIERNESLFTEAMARGESGYGAHPDAGSPEAAFGHDLWLTSQGHGVGFWDRSELDRDQSDPNDDDASENLGARLTEACRAAFGHGSVNATFYRGGMYLDGELQA